MFILYYLYFILSLFEIIYLIHLNLYRLHHLIKTSSMGVLGGGGEEGFIHFIFEEELL